ncbi:acyltransferase [Rhodoblastus sp. 17X3]|uniref:acyltransferase family protein n=1 Tax=Rhodoblastus sp. 17X3 TaxID=3047026 RepID=UPI0024B806EF|nr:acyltransferase [Rhodoblastus sp. 17X3]MDI9848013.1 acyltransferase [Rhodoblastus sp. 17X3]
MTPMSYPVFGICVGAVLAFVAAIVIAEMIAKAGFPLPSGGKRIGRIDGLRGFMALSVMISHFVIWLEITRLGGSWAPPSAYLFAQLGAGAVTLFFMTTGLLFYPRILAGFQANSWPAVFIARAFRLIPLSSLTFVCVTAVVMVKTGRHLDADFPGAALQWITAAGMPPLLGYADPGRVNAYVLWSLKYEWQFYLVALPVCALLVDLLARRLPSWMLPAAIILVSSIGKKFVPGVNLWKFMPLFATGMLAYEAQNRPVIARWLQSRAATWCALLALVVATTQFKSPYDLAWPLFAIFFFAVACGNDLGGLLRTKAALVLGECSYGLYLMHGIALFLLFTRGGALTDLFATPFLPLLMPLVAIVLVALTSATYLLVERPGMNAGKILADRWRSFAGRKLSFAAK